MKSDYELKHLCLEYMAPWLPNLARLVLSCILGWQPELILKLIFLPNDRLFYRFFRYPADDPQKVKMTHILEELINLTVKEKGVSLWLEFVT